jgi:hypothetical protein
VSFDVYADAQGPKRRPGLALARANQKLFAERLRWPPGALAACWDLERKFRGWHVSWLPVNRIAGFERPAGFWATWDDFHHAEVFREDPEAVAERLTVGVPDHEFGKRGCPWCLAHVGTRRVKL